MLYEVITYFGTIEGLYASDGTPGGTVKVFEIFEAHNLTVLGDKLIFIATDADPFPSVPTRDARITSYNVCYTKLLRPSRSICM